MKLYKITFRRFFKKYLAEIGYQDRVLDFACADAKFTSLFDCSYYCGLDYDEGRIKFAKSRFPGGGYAFFQMDFLTDPIPVQEKFNLCVCTHTLSHIEEKDHQFVINKLSKCVEDGFLINHLPSRYFSTFKFLQKNFDVMQSVRYGGKLSHFFL